MDEFEGMPEDEATVAAMNQGYTVRVTSRDGTYFFGDRVRFFVGNLHAWDEREQGGRRGPELLICLSTDHVGEFDRRVYGDRWRHDSHWYLSHHASVIVWHWGISLTVRGRAIDGPAWDSHGSEDAAA